MASGKKNPASGMIMILAVMFVMMMAYSIPWLREGVGATIDGVAGPLVEGYGIPFFAFILFLSCITAAYSSLIQKYTIDYDKMQETQAKMRDFQKEFREAQLSKDEKKIKKLEGKRARMMEDQMEMSTQQFRPMIFILILTVPIFFWLLYRLPAYDPLTFTATLNNAVVMPFYGIKALTEVILVFLPTWIVWYMICSLLISQIVRKALNIGGV